MPIDHLIEVCVSVIEGSVGGDLSMAQNAPKLRLKRFFKKSAT